MNIDSSLQNKGILLLQAIKVCLFIEASGRAGLPGVQASVATDA
jgi:hypothetical protein